MLDNNTRNELVMKYHRFIKKTIRNNKTLFIALNIDEEDAYQDLMLDVIKAIDKFDPARCDCLDKHVNAQLRYGVLRMKARYKPHGVVGKEARHLEYVSADAASSDYFAVDSDIFLTELADAFDTLTSSEHGAVEKAYAGHSIGKAETEHLESGRDKLRMYFSDTAGAGERLWAI